MWNEVEFTLIQCGRVVWGAEVGLRLRDGIGQLYDRRAGTVVEVGLSKGISVSGGYMIRNRDISGFGFDWNSRAVAQLNYTLYRFRSMELGGATAYERQMGRPDVPDYNRYRQRFELESGKTGFSPWIYQDFTFLRDGFYRSRSRLGMVWRSQRAYEFAVAYQFESIRVPLISAMIPRHTIYTTISIDKPFWKSPR